MEVESLMAPIISEQGSFRKIINTIFDGIKRLMGTQVSETVIVQKRHDLEVALPSLIDSILNAETDVHGEFSSGKPIFGDFFLMSSDDQSGRLFIAKGKKCIELPGIKMADLKKIMLKEYIARQRHENEQRQTGQSPDTVDTRAQFIDIRQFHLPENFDFNGVDLRA